MPVWHGLNAGSRLSRPAGGAREAILLSRAIDGRDLVVFRGRTPEMGPGERKGKSPRTGSGACVAQVFLRSRSGHSYRELREGPLPRDLSLYLPTPSARREVTDLFSRLGFRTYADDMGLTISIEGSAELFSKVFEVTVRRVAAPPPTETVALRSPEEVRELIEEIVLLPRPELHRSS